MVNDNTVVWCVIFLASLCTYFWSHQGMIEIGIVMAIIKQVNSFLTHIVHTCTDSMYVMHWQLWVWYVFVNCILKKNEINVFSLQMVCCCECRTVPMALTWTLYQHGKVDTLGEVWLSPFLMMALKKIIQISRGTMYVFLHSSC